MQNTPAVSLVIFTCQGREFLLSRTLKSFRDHCSFNFSKTLIGIDGDLSPGAIAMVNADVVIQNTHRKGYVRNIATVLKLVDTPYFFWLEDDWSFHKPLALDSYLQALSANNDWVEIFLSKYGPLSSEQKKVHMGGNFYQSPEFSANPCLCKAGPVKEAFVKLIEAPKGETLGTDGFENYLTASFGLQQLKCIIIDPVDHTPISHEGYLESTPRSWHMTASLEKKSEKHLLTIPAPSFWRKMLMVIKLFAATIKLAIHQLFSNKAYEYCFRIIAMAKNIHKDG